MRVLQTHSAFQAGLQQPVGGGGFGLQPPFGGAATLPGEAQDGVRIIRSQPGGPPAALPPPGA